MSRSAGVTAALTLAAAVLTALVVLGWSPLLRLDTTVVDRVNAAVAPHPGQVTAWAAVSAVLGPTVLRVLALVVVVLAWWRRWRYEAALVAVAALGAGAWSAGLKLAVDRPRPSPPVRLDTAASASFPSGHAMTSLVAAGLVVALLAPRVQGWHRGLLVVLAVAAALLVGASRIALGDHYPSDVLGGWLVGAAWLGVSLLLAPHLPGVPARTTRGARTGA